MSDPDEIIASALDDLSNDYDKIGYDFHNALEKCIRRLRDTGIIDCCNCADELERLHHKALIEGQFGVGEVFFIKVNIINPLREKFRN